MSRQDTAMAARKVLLTDFFGGWDEADLALLAPYQHGLVGEPRRGELINWLGIRTDLAMHSWLDIPADGVIHVLDIPIPSDMVHAETIEYVAMIVALERAAELNRSRFVVMELGASYAPWAVASGVLANRMQFETIEMIAVEASAASVPNISAHAARNGLDKDGNITLRPIHAAVHLRDEPVYFPRVNVSDDNGAQMSTEATKTDYRGLAVDHDEVAGISLETLCRDHERIDFVHLDLQGAEEGLLTDRRFLGTLTSKVSTFFLATQSRLIEGIALKRLSELGWVLVRERPTTYQFNTRTPDVNGWTLRDGGQIWLNPKFSSRHLDL